jgi:hypothetical protein
MIANNGRRCKGHDATLIRNPHKCKYDNVYYVLYDVLLCMIDRWCMVNRQNDTCMKGISSLFQIITVNCD